MKRLLLLMILFLCCAFCGYGQRLHYTGVFAPSEDLVKPAEKPYRADICLNGLWQFEPVGLPAGFREGVDAAPPLPAIDPEQWDRTPIRIPSPWNVNSFAGRNGEGGDFRTYPSYPKTWEHIEMGWLKKDFTVPSAWKGKRVLLKFDAVAGDAEIKINGKTAGRHYGVFLPFVLDVTDLVVPGQQNELCVGVRKASLFDKRGPYGHRLYQGGSFWGQHIAGIWQDVYLEAVPVVHITNVYVKPSVDADELEAEVTLKNDGNSSRKVILDADAHQWLRSGGQSVSALSIPSSSLASATALHLPAVTAVVGPHSEIKLTLKTHVKHSLKAWSPAAPNLYGLVINERAGGRLTDKKYTRFGWRQITFDGAKVLLNGKPVIMRGDSWHFLGIPEMTRRYAVAWFTAMRRANLNAVRLHAQPYPPCFLDVADEMGILVLDETAVWASDGGQKLNDPAFWENTKTHLTDFVLRDRNHPSVFGWSVANEVLPIVTNIMRNPPGMRDTLDKYYGIWLGICHRLDPTRPWVSADGDEDGDGRLPVYIIHYGGAGALARGRESGKPWGVGEAGNAYYATPEQVAGTNGDRAYESFLGRMEGVADDSYHILVQQRDSGAIYRSVFNMVWYGLKPLPLGLKDTTKAPTLNDGVYFTSFREGQPGVQPERLGPYCTTLNPGYDPSLPLYQPWPLFYAIKDAGAEPLAGQQKWKPRKPAVLPATPRAAITSVRLLGSAGSRLKRELTRTGVPFAKLDNGKTPQVLFIDGIHPPEGDAVKLINQTCQNGGIVMVWGASDSSLAVLNRLLPAPLEITSRTSSSLLPVQKDSLISGLSVADMYFSQLRPPLIITHGLAGRLVDESKVLLKANHTDWLRWNSQPEYAKTAMVVRSERESVPSGVAMIKKKIGNGWLVVTTLPAAPRHEKEEAMVRRILLNAGIPLGAGNDTGNPLLKDGTIARALYCGNFPIDSLGAGISANFVDPASDDKIRADASSDGKIWRPVYAENGVLDLSRLRMATGPRNNAVAYLSFWVSSPRSLDDLLTEPNVPVVNMDVDASDAVQVYLNGNRIIDNIHTGDAEGGKAAATALKLRQGWNHFLIKLIHAGGRWQFSGRLTCNQPDFLSKLTSALEKP